ncbi:YcxB-like protein [Flavobacterium aquidurense]|uniref:YcxB-like protein n=1 Tax=Flavobacterium frigidimaris TaxID=262320 RepID=A0ABX4BK13_FLAFR|nr:hypothetical protein [Flavobacterium frigidimaris]OXA75165.1 hypothetical protein B0A65_22385 [Flavobacterium frigidimaris]SDZ66590.1 YcxB-like protein [Flavobacterium aquidurense]
MGTYNFSLEFGLNVDEAKMINKMYLKNRYEQWVQYFLGLALLFPVFFDFFDRMNNSDLIVWILRDMFFVLIFFMLQYPFVDAICKLIFQLIKKLLKIEKFITKYRFNFTSTFIYVHSPLGAFAHKWTQVESAILTKDFFFLYVKEKNGYIISIANNKQNRKINELIAFVEKNVIQITKV